MGTADWGVVIHANSPRGVLGRGLDIMGCRATWCGGGIKIEMAIAMAIAYEMNGNSL